MSLSTSILNTPRIREAHANNRRAIGIGEPQSQDVARIQSALKRLGFDLPISSTPPGLLDGIFGRETRDAVVRFQRREHLKDDGWVGHDTLERMDALLRALPPVPPPVPPAPATGRSGASLARDDATLAIRKAAAAHLAVGKVASVLLSQALLGPGEGPAPDFDLVTLDALRTHFRLAIPDDDNTVPAPTRALTLDDLNQIAANFRGIQSTLGNAGMLVDGIPRDKHGHPVVAAAPVGGPIQISGLYRDFDAADGARIGPNSRAAVLIHEATHVVDSASGVDGVTHISEFDPAYETQPASQSIHNPSSYASFAAHVVDRRDPAPRYGLGAGRFR